ncbi:MAG: SUMF1/EgtB/PvdO family nonheme iron enzyme [Candidatus Poribacteria bacterium]|nr:SUMF1/EgtB/PvdO family nonheme iron enzyme [Candidatus Poribacteria bacterium]MDP6751081.1 SUMF1/EgtB/PvdO family nonheme iron enzyme [Candidatus Poribacteria bacterium]
MKPKIAHLIWLALTLAILPTISLADNLPNQILWNKDGAEMSYIPAGSFEMGDHLNNMSSALPVHTVTLDGFYMDKTEVTVGQFKAFLADSDHDWDQWASVVAIYGEDDEDSLADDYPMIYVNWHDAVAYAEWDSKSDLGEAVASGVYFVQFTTDDQTQTRRLVILK